MHRRDYGLNRSDESGHADYFSPCKTKQRRDVLEASGGWAAVERRSNANDPGPVHLLASSRVFSGS